MSYEKGLSTGNVQLDHKMKSIGKKAVRSTAGAILSKNEKGEAILENVKVERYKAGKVPQYVSILEDSSKMELVSEPKTKEKAREIKSFPMNIKLQEPIIIKEPEATYTTPIIQEDLLLKRQALKQRLLEQQKSNLLETIEEKEETSEYSESSELSEENIVPRLKPLFVRKNDRFTINQQKKEETLKEELEDKQQKFIAEERREESRNLVSHLRKMELVEEQNLKDEEEIVLTDEESDNEETEFELWKLRELKRIKRDIEERQERENEKLEIEKLRTMSEEERNRYFEENPKLVTNLKARGEYKFLQKYYHRGAFYLDQEDELFKRNIDEPTLEDHFDKSTMPKVLQVKNFGKAGRTKYTHLTDQDTTDFFTNRDKASVAIPEYAEKFHNKISAGKKQIFNNPLNNKRKRKTE